MKKGFKVKIHPNKEQQILMQKTFGCTRFAYNWALDRQIESYKNGNGFISESNLRKQFTQFKKVMRSNGEGWLYDIPNNAMKQSIKDCFKAYDNFFNGRAKRPRFKSKKHSKFSFYNDTCKIKIFEDKVQLEVIGIINLAEKGRIPNGKIYNPKVSFDGLNYWLSLSVEVDDNQINEDKTESIGIDLGIKMLMSCSNEMNFNRINTRKERKRLKRLQRKASRHYTNMYNNKTTEKSNNLIKLEKSILKQHQKISNIRLNNIHQITTELIKLNPSHIVIEDLNVKGMMRNRHLSEKVADCSFREIRRQLEYKCEWNNIDIIIADRWYASSKICSDCGNKKKKLSLSERTYKCECCGLEIDRDYNASINLKNLAM
ncbi:RNA-guided endonuclease InsQ/TnpB family protein [Clostridium sp.]|uniref:RNA-guided endonuclease InsQ/TnpB family protein n=1 Tax=Clostridium sp. TaxID=1506 RepID=UPI003F33F8C3